MKLTDLIETMIDGALDDVHTALPARVERFDPTTLRGEVVPLIKRRFEKGADPEPLPPILDVPFVMPKAGSFVMRWPVRRGDVVLLVFSERALDYILTDGRPQDPQLRRRHALDDAIAIPGMLHRGEGTLPAEHGEDVLLLHRDKSVKLVMRSDGTMLIENPEASAKWEMAENGEITLTVPPHVVRLVPNGPAIIESPTLLLGSETAEEGVPLGQTLKEWLDTHTHSANGAGPPTSPSPAPSEKVFVE